MQLRVMRHAIVGGELVEVLEDLRTKLLAYGLDGGFELIDLGDARVAVEVHEQLVDRLQQGRGLSVHPLARHHTKLLHRSD